MAATDQGRSGYVPPVNYRLQKLIEHRAGRRPRAVWVRRASADRDDFPTCLTREGWDDRVAAGLCRRYLRRLAPRLLMLQGPPQTVRQRLEQEAREHVFDVERLHALYPEVIDNHLVNAARVEARLRRASGA